MNDFQAKTILTGKKGEGKSTFINQLICELGDSGYKIGGLYSPGLYRKGNKVGIEVINLLNGDKRLLAEHAPGWDPEKPIREWRFIHDSVVWGNEILKNHATPCDVLIVDEIGYLELEKDKGWNSIFDTLHNGRYKQAYVVVRESLLNKALFYWPDANVIHLDNIKDKTSIIQEELNRISTLE